MPTLRVNIQPFLVYLSTFDTAEPVALILNMHVALQADFSTEILAHEVVTVHSRCCTSYCLYVKLC